MRQAVLIFAAALAGCSAIQELVAHDSGEILAQANFQRAPLHEPSLPERQLVRDGATYRFEDARFCACVYVGGANEHQALEQLRVERIAAHAWSMQHATYGSEDSPMHWGPWKPEGLDLIPAALARANTRVQRAER